MRGVSHLCLRLGNVGGVNDGMGGANDGMGGANDGMGGANDGMGGVNIYGAGESYFLNSAAQKIEGRT